MKIIEDLRAYIGKAKYPIELLNILFYINVLYRIGHCFCSIYLVFIAKLFWIINRLLFSVDIDPHAKIGGGFVIKHGLGLVIGDKVQIGKNCRIYQGVTIGGNSNKTQVYKNEILYQPLIGDDVVLSVNAIVIGPIIIGNRVQIGSGAIVTKDIAEDCVVVGNNNVLTK